jgi:hypothetical protein
MNFSLILPTRERPRLVKRLMASIARTTTDLDGLEIVLGLEQDDTQTQDLCRHVVSVTTVRTQDETMGSMTRRCYEQCQGKYVMLINDDMVFRTRGWDIKVMEALARFPDGVAMVYGNDLYYASRMCTFPVLPRESCDLMDKICPPQYRRHCIDPHVFDVFQRLAHLGQKRSVYLPDVIFEHMHYNPAALFEPREAAVEGDEDDQQVYFALVDDRKRTAERMAAYIELQATGDPHSRQAH